MNKREKIILIVLGVLVVICLVVFFLFNNDNKNNSNNDNKNNLVLDGEYVFVTNMSYKTMANDGGNHVDIYYEVNLRNNVVVKKQDEYKGFEGKVSEKILRTYAINDYQKNKIKNIFDKIIEEKDKEIDYSKIDRMPYTLKTSDGLNVKTYNDDLINQFEMFFK